MCLNEVVPPGLRVGVQAETVCTRLLRPCAPCTDVGIIQEGSGADIVVEGGRWQPNGSMPSYQVLTTPGVAMMVRADTSQPSSKDADRVGQSGADPPRSERA